MTYLEYQPSLAPPWLAGPWGTKWLQAAGLSKDALRDATSLAVKSRYIGGPSPDDSLVYAGRDRDLERAPGESTSSYRARLVSAWDAYVWAGTKKGILDQLTVAGFPNVKLYENDELTGSDFDPSQWWRFAITIYPPHGLGDGTGIPRWGDGHHWGDGHTWAGLPKDRVDLIKRIIRKWKAAHTTCIRVRVVLSGHLWGDPSLTWSSFSYGGVSISFVP